MPQGAGRYKHETPFASATSGKSSEKVLVSPQRLYTLFTLAIVVKLRVARRLSAPLDAGLLFLPAGSQENCAQEKEGILAPNCALAVILEPYSPTR